MAARATPRSARLDETADRLHSAAIHLLRRVRREDEASGLGPARLSALSVVVFGGPIRISDLARAEQVRTPTMTPIAAALARAGLVTREADAADARAAVLRATPKGRRLLAEGRSRRVRRLTAELQSLTPGERRTVRAAAGILLRLFRPAR
jgi:DNA-binding MarR family transcriptional regulator